MPRVIWKGAISFGLVNIPVVLKAGARAQKLDFDWLDKRDMAPVGYSRINKRTGKPIESENIVKGYQYEKGEYVLMSDEDFKQANPEATQTVDIQSFADAKDIPPYYFETPYYLEPDRRGHKGYALLREVLRRTGRAAIATVVIHTRQHLAAVLVQGPLLVLNTMRFAKEVLPWNELDLPDDDLADVGVGKRELEMAQRLVDEMTEAWQPERHANTYHDDLMARIDAKINAGQTHALTPPGEAPAPAGAQVIDLVAMLRESIKARGGKAADEPGEPRERAPSPRRKASGTATRTSRTTTAETTRSPAKSAGKSSARTASPARARSRPADEPAPRARNVKAAADASKPTRRRQA